MTERAIQDGTAKLTPGEAHRIVYRLGAYDFAWDIEKALEFALFRTYAVPSISGLLAKTGEFEKRPRKRYDDTELILAEIAENGPDSGRGQAALARMNAMHGAYRISNDDMLYVLSTFIFEPIRWIDRFGWRLLSEQERQAIFEYYVDLGRRMGICDLPADPGAFEAFNIEYEARHFQFHDTNALIGRATTDLLLSFYLPRVLIPLGRPAVAAMMDPPLRRAMGVGDPPRWVAVAVPGALRIRSRMLGLLPKRRRPRLLTRRRRPTYPAGYQIAQLGTFPEASRPR